jgi:putative ABC transport system substrate-binding protein
MNRRDAVIALLALGAPSFVVRAQQAGKIPRLCFLTFDPGTLQSTRFSVFFDALRDLGYVDGKTIAIDYLSANARPEQYPVDAAECVRRKADVIVVASTPAAQAAKKATRTIPIVMLSLGDPVGAGLIDSLARPGGNVTGMTYIAGALAAKRVEILRELSPRISRVLVLTYPSDPISATQIESMKQAAASMGVTLYIQNIRAAADLPAAFDAGAKEHVQGLITTVESIFIANHAQVIELAAKHRLPAVYGSTLFAPNGGLISYSANFPLLYTSAASYVDKILKGAKPADLPVMQPTQFMFELNLKTAKALGITIPRTILMRADRVIE